MNSYSEYLSKDYRSVENIITNYSESIYATSGAHKGLNIEHYTQCSSALRRGADIIVQRGLDLFYYNLFDDRQRYIFEDQLEERVKKLNQQKDNIKRFIQKSKPKSRGR